MRKDLTIHCNYRYIMPYFEMHTVLAPKRENLYRGSIDKLQNTGKVFNPLSQNFSSSIDHFAFSNTLF